MTNWESVSAPRGTFIAWGNEPGQNVTGKVISVGTGKDRNQNPVPEIAVELTQAAFSYSTTKNERTDLEAGATAIVTCGLSNLKKNIIAAELAPGDMVSITLDSLFPTDKSPAKIFEVKKAKGAAPVQQSAASDPWGANSAQPSFAGFGESSDITPKAPF